MAVDLNLLMLLKNLLKWTEHGTISQNHCESRRQLSLLMWLFSPNSPFIYFSQHAYYNVKTNWERQRDIFALYFGNIYFIVLHCTFSLTVPAFCLIMELRSLIYSIYYSHNTTLRGNFQVIMKSIIISKKKRLITHSYQHVTHIFSHSKSLHY